MAPALGARHRANHGDDAHRLGGDHVAERTVPLPGVPRRTVEQVPADALPAGNRSRSRVGAARECRSVKLTGPRIIFHHGSTEPRKELGFDFRSARVSERQLRRFLQATGQPDAKPANIHQNVSVLPCFRSEALVRGPPRGLFERSLPSRSPSARRRRWLRRTARGRRRGRPGRHRRR